MRRVVEPPVLPRSRRQHLLTEAINMPVKRHAFPPSAGAALSTLRRGDAMRRPAQLPSSNAADSRPSKTAPASRVIESGPSKAKRGGRSNAAIGPREPAQIRPNTRMPPHPRIQSHALAGRGASIVERRHHSFIQHYIREYRPHRPLAREYKLHPILGSGVPASAGLCLSIRVICVIRGQISPAAAPIASQKGCKTSATPINKTDENTGRIVRRRSEPARRAPVRPHL